METRRVLRDDTKTKDFIDCLIPNLEAFTEEHDKLMKIEAMKSIRKNNAVIKAHWNVLQRKRKDPNHVTESKQKIKVSFASTNIGEINEALSRPV